MLHALAESQSMGKLLHAFKNVRNMETFLENNVAPTDETPPILIRETMSYRLLRYFAFHQLRMPQRERQYSEGQGFSCLRAGHGGPRKHV
jgi:hypothetical protein